MKKLDFLFSQSPKTFIFKAGANKTKFGGFFFIIYIIISLVIFSIYLYNYIINNKYTVQYLLHFRNNEELNKAIYNLNFNPNISFSFELFKLQKRDSIPEAVKLNDKYKLFDPYEYEFNNKNFKVIKRNTAIYKRVLVMTVGIIYECDDSNCKMEEDLSDITNIINIQYDGFKIDHEDADPIQNQTNFYSIPFYKNKFTGSVLIWENVIYKHSSTGIDFFRCLKDSYYNGFINDFYMMDLETNDQIIQHNGRYYKCLGTIEFRLNPQYIEYSRKRDSELDTIGIMMSLWGVSFNILQFIFSLYSQNFDNYKIIEKILGSNKNNNQQNNGTNLPNFKGLNESPITNTNKTNNDKKLELIQIDKSSPLVDDLPEENNLIINDDGYNNAKKDNDGNIQLILPKLSFKDFYINNFYCCCKSPDNRQEIINICNEIIFQYYSIDYIIYNLIKLDNLFKDYKWNNPSLNNIETNEMFIKLKSVL